MIQTFHAFPVRAAVAAVAVNVINGLNDNTTIAAEVDNDFEWILMISFGR